jgi:hypothetical protein
MLVSSQLLPAARAYVLVLYRKGRKQLLLEHIAEVDPQPSFFFLFFDCQFTNLPIYHLTSN